MKRSLFSFIRLGRMTFVPALAALCFFLITSCDESDVTTTTSSKDAKAVTFALSVSYPSIESMVTTRATTSISTAPTRLLVLDYMDGQLMQSYECTTDDNQVTTSVTKVDDLLSNLSLTLTYGTHDIYIVAAVKPYESFDTSQKIVTWTTDHSLSYTWASKVSVTVSQTSSEAQSVTLPLAVGLVYLASNDAKDANASKIQITGNMSWALDLNTMKGVSVTTPWSCSVDVSSSTKLKIGLFSFEPTSGSLGDMTFTAQTSDGTEIISHTLTSVPLVAGYMTKYTGNFFSNSQGFSLTTANQWTGVTELTY